MSRRIGRPLPVFCRHFMNMERPETFNRIVREFIDTANLENADTMIL